MTVESKCKDFLVQVLYGDDTFSNRIYSSMKLLEYVSMDDCHGEDYQIFALMGPGDIRSLHQAGWQPGCRIRLYDEFGEVILDGIGIDH